MNHISFHTLFDFIENHLPPTESEGVTAHIAACLTCQRDIGLARRTLRALHSPPTVEPPVNLQQRLATAFRRKQARPAQLLYQVAELQMDRTALVQAGTRGQIQERQMLYSIGGFDLDLHVGLDNLYGLLLHGQLLGDPAQQNIELEGTEVHLTHSDSTRYLGLTDNLGRFHLSYLATGSYSLRLLLGQLELVCEPLLLTA